MNSHDAKMYNKVVLLKILLYKATISWNIVHHHPCALKIKVNNHHIFKLVYFYYLTTFCNIKFFISFSLYCLFLYLFWLLFKIFYLKDLFHFLTKGSAFSEFWLSWKIYWCIMLSEHLHGKIFINITIFKHVIKVWINSPQQEYENKKKIVA